MIFVMRRLFALFLLIALSAPAAAKSFSFAVIGDSRGKYEGVNDPVLGVLASHLASNQKAVRFVVFPGDMIDGSPKHPERTRRELAHWAEVMAPVYDSPHMVWPKLWPLPGNHEMQHPEDVKSYREAFPDVYMNGPEHEKGLTYSFDHGTAHFAMVTTDRYLIGDPDDPDDDRTDWYAVRSLDWLRTDLAAARKRGARQLFVFGHDPAFPITDAHLDDGLPRIGVLKGGRKPSRVGLRERDAFWDILKEQRVAAYIHSHAHVYGRQSVGGVYQIASGGGGAPLYSLNSCKGAKPSPTAPKSWMSVDEVEPYYKVLGYPLGPKGNCQASPDFVGGSFFHYLVFDVKKNSVKVTAWGIDPIPGKRKKIVAGAVPEIKDSFTIRIRK